MYPALSLPASVFPCCFLITFSLNELWLLEPWWYLANQPSFSSVLCRKTVHENVSSVEGVIQHTIKVRGGSKMADLIDLQVSLLLLQTFVFQKTNIDQLLIIIRLLPARLYPLFPTCRIWHANWCWHSSGARKPAIFLFQLWINFSASEPISYFVEMLQTISKWGAWTRTEPVPC